MLDSKAAQNLSILLGGSLKHMSYEHIRTCILRCDTTVLTANVLDLLIQVSRGSRKSRGNSVKSEKSGKVGIVGKIGRVGIVITISNKLQKTYITS